MALTLAETLSKDVQSAAAPNLQPGATEAAQRLLTTKATGREIGPSAVPTISTQAEKSAIQAGQAALGKQKLQAQLAAESQAQQAQAQEQRVETEQRSILTKAKAQKSDYQRRANRYLQDFQRGVRALDDDKEALAVEMMGHNMRLSNDKYLHNLQMVDKKLDLESDLAWRQENARSIISSELENAYDVIDFNTMVKADDRAYERQLASMSMETAQQLMSENIKQANKEAQYEGVSGLFKGGIQAGEKYAEYKKDNPELESPSGYKTVNGQQQPIYG